MREGRSEGGSRRARAEAGCESAGASREESRAPRAAPSHSARPFSFIAQQRASLYKPLPPSLSRTAISHLSSPFPPPAGQPTRLLFPPFPLPPHPPRACRRPGRWPIARPAPAKNTAPQPPRPARRALTHPRRRHRRATRPSRRSLAGEIPTTSRPPTPLPPTTSSRPPAARTGRSTPRTPRRRRRRRPPTRPTRRRRLRRPTPSRQEAPTRPPIGSRAGTTSLRRAPASACRLARKALRRPAAGRTALTATRCVVPPFSFQGGSSSSMGRSGCRGLLLAREARREVAGTSSLAPRRRIGSSDGHASRPPAQTSASRPATPRLPSFLSSPASHALATARLGLSRSAR